MKNVKEKPWAIIGFIFVCFCPTPKYFAWASAIFCQPFTSVPFDSKKWFFPEMHCNCTLGKSQYNTKRSWFEMGIFSLLTAVKLTVPLTFITYSHFSDFRKFQFLVFWKNVFLMFFFLIIMFWFFLCCMHCLEQGLRQQSWSVTTHTIPGSRSREKRWNERNYKVVHEFKVSNHWSDSLPPADRPLVAKRSQKPASQRQSST